MKKDLGYCIVKEGDITRILSYPNRNYRQVVKEALQKSFWDSNAPDDSYKVEPAKAYNISFAVPSGKNKKKKNVFGFIELVEQNRLFISNGKLTEHHHVEVHDFVGMTKQEIIQRFLGDK